MAKKPEQADKPLEDETPFERFERVVKQVIAVPKTTLDEREREWKERRRKASS